MPVAAPGEHPQAAVVPGRSWVRAIIQPAKVLAATVVSTTSTIAAQSSAMVRRMEGSRARATRQPMIAWAQNRNGGGT